MHSGSNKLFNYSKKGITLVELVVAMTLTSLFAVVCIALINPIEKMYRSTIRLSKAQLLADTVVDAIRKECDDVMHKDSSDVWIAYFIDDETSSDVDKDDSRLLSVGPSSSFKKEVGNALIFRRNNNYTEAIYSAVPISQDNIDAVNDEDNPVTKNTGHSVDAFIGSDLNKLNRGVVHFGYYQSKEDDRGVFPIRAYDYTNPVTVSTYGTVKNDLEFTVKLEFSDLTLKDGKYPSHVTCKVSVYEGKYYKNNDSKVDSKGPVYTRSTVISFSANGSGKGSGGGSYTPSDKKDVYVRVRWLNENGETTSWPADILSVSISLNGADTAKNWTLYNGSYGFIFGNVKFTGEPSLSASDFSDYDKSITGNPNSGYVVTYKLADVKTVKLICGEKFSSLIEPANVTGVVFGQKQEWLAEFEKFKAEGATVSGPIQVAIPYDANYDQNGNKDAYLLYKVTQNGKLTVYVLSKDGKFVLNNSCKNMFINCKQLVSITGLTTDDAVSSIFNNELTINMQSMFEGCEKITSFKLAGLVSFRVTTTEAMFKNCSGALTCDLSNWNTSGVTSMKEMFYKCANLNLHSEKWDWNTSKVTDFTYMFSLCDVKADTDFTINISSFKFHQTQKINMSHMFESSGVKTIVFPASVSDSAGKVTNIESMFNSCTRLEAIDNFLVNKETQDAAAAATVNPVVFSGVTSANYVFYNCFGLKNVRLKISLPACTKINEFFYHCDSLESIDLSGSNFSKVTDLKWFFHFCNNMEKAKMNEIVLSKFSGSTATVFEECYSLRWLEMKDSDLHSVTNARFITRDSLNHLDLSRANLSGMTSCENMFQVINNKNKKQLQSVIMEDTDLSKSSSFKNMFKDCQFLTSVVFKPKYSSTITSFDCTGMFQSCYKLKTFDYTGTDTVFNSGKITNMSSMFKNCYALETIDLTGFNTENVTDMSSMFEECNNAISINLSGWDTSKVTHMDRMFFDFAADHKDHHRTSAQYLTVNISGFSFGALETCGFMFNTEASGGYNDYITEIILPSDPERAKALNLTNCERMFRKRAHLERIVNLELLATTTNLTLTTSMFSECNKLEVIDISSMNLSFVTNAQWMFNFAANQTPDRLITIFVSSDPEFAFDPSKFSNETGKEMFKGRTLLTGQEGTTCNGTNNINFVYARVDDRTNGKPGYFTAK